MKAAIAMAEQLLVPEDGSSAGEQGFPRSVGPGVVGHVFAEQMASDCARHAVQSLRLVPSGAADGGEGKDGAAAMADAEMQPLWKQLLEHMAEAGFHHALLRLRRNHSDHRVAVMGACSRQTQHSSAHGRNRGSQPGRRAPANRHTPCRAAAVPSR